jgi:hypothetical protein
MREGANSGMQMRVGRLQNGISELTLGERTVSQSRQHIGTMQSLWARDVQSQVDAVDNGNGTMLQRPVHATVPVIPVLPVVQEYEKVDDEFHTPISRPSVPVQCLAGGSGGRGPAPNPSEPSEGGFDARDNSGKKKPKRGKQAKKAKGAKPAPGDDSPNPSSSSSEASDSAEGSASDNDGDDRRDTSAGSMALSSAASVTGKRRRFKKGDLLKLLGQPTVGNLRDWKVHMRKAVVSNANKGLATLAWLLMAENLEISFEELAVCDDEWLEVELRLAEAMNRILVEPLKREVTLREEQLVAC